MIERADMSRVKTYAKEGRPRRYGAMGYGFSGDFDTIEEAMKVISANPPDWPAALYRRIPMPEDRTPFGIEELGRTHAEHEPYGRWAKVTDDEGMFGLVVRNGNTIAATVVILQPEDAEALADAFDLVAARLRQGSE